MNEPTWETMTPNEIIDEFVKRHVNDTFTQGDQIGPAKSDIVEAMAIALRACLKVRYVFDLPQPMTDMIDLLVSSGLFGQTGEDVIERLVARHLAAMLEDGSPFLMSTLRVEGER